jgi:hypothetical protein
VLCRRRPSFCRLQCSSVTSLRQHPASGGSAGKPRSRQLWRQAASSGALLARQASQLMLEIA